MENIEINLFDEPQGDIAGIAILSHQLGKKYSRLAHSTLFVGRAPLIQLSIKASNLAVEEIEKIAHSLHEFSSQLSEAQNKLASRSDKRANNND